MDHRVLNMRARAIKEILYIPDAKNFCFLLLLRCIDRPCRYIYGVRSYAFIYPACIWFFLFRYY